MRIKISEEWVIKNNWIIDLNEDGEFELPDDREYDYDAERGEATIEGKYFLEDWVFYPAVLEIVMDHRQFQELHRQFGGDAIFLTEWKDYFLTPGDRCQVLKRGNPEVLRHTTFESFLKGGETNEA